MAVNYLLLPKIDVELPKVNDYMAKSRVYPKTSLAIGRIIKCLKNGPKTNLELKKLLPIPVRSIDRYLTQYLKPWGLADKDEYERWTWFQHLPKIFSSQEESNRVWAHSKLILPAFESIVENPLVAFGDDTMYAVQHIKTGYPEVYKILENYREVFIKARKAENELLLDYPDFNMYLNLLSFAITDHRAPFRTDIFKDVPKVTQLKCMEIYEKKVEAERNLYNETRKIIQKVKHGKLLFGECDLCPFTRTGESLET